MAQAQDSNPMLQPPMPPAQPPALQEGALAPVGPVGPEGQSNAPGPQGEQPPMPWQQPQPTQVTEATFMAARLRESLAEAANLRQMVADLQVENAGLRAKQAQAEIAQLDKAYQVGQGTMLVGKADGTFWRLPKQPQQQPAT